MFKNILLVASVIVLCLATFKVEIGSANVLALGIALGFASFLVPQAK